jgi:UDP-N-acetylmuramate dehydrogenase
MEVREHVMLAPYTTLGVGGPARWFAEVRSERDAEEAAAFARGRGLPVFVLGGGSNLLVADGGFEGLVLHVAVVGVETDGAGLFQVGAGEDWDRFVSRTVAAGCAGMECLAGIPGTVGGTPVQNVGAYGQEVAQTIVRVRGLALTTGEWREWEAGECGFGYRRSRFNTSERGLYVITRVDFALKPGGAPTLTYADLQKHFGPGSSPSLAEVAEAVRVIRKGKGMVVVPGDADTQSAGSFFKNPIVAPEVYEAIAERAAPAAVPHWPAPAGAVKLAAAWLVERAGFARGYRKGRAGISTRHTLALTNRGGATAAEVMALRDEIVTQVRATFGVNLEPEPVLLG